MTDFVTGNAPDALPLMPLLEAELDGWLAEQPERVRHWVEANGFVAKPGTHLRIPDAGGRVERVVAGMEALDDLWSWAELPAALKAGAWRVERPLEARAATEAATGWGLATYVFDRYKSRPDRFATLVRPEGVDERAATAIVEGVFQARDLINTPAADMGPGELADAARRLGRRFEARVEVLVGDDLLKHDYPTIHAVGRASERAPRLIDLVWGDEAAPKITLVGKGVCFDTGGLDLKTASGMRLMKKDMGGAAAMLGLASMIMAVGLPVRLRLLIPAVENSVSGNAMRPLDVIRTRKGITVEVGNTDAEGRLVLCDALAEADSEEPALILDAATLTGAARVALGPALPALFANDDRLAADLLAAGEETSDPLWRMPLYAPYRKMLDSDVADINNVSDNGFAGAVTAALYLREFVSATTPWAHVDMMAWNPTARPGRPKGGEAQAVRAAFAMLRKRYG
jgi:leucyl aminopeptidase